LRSTLPRSYSPCNSSNRSSTSLGRWQTESSGRVWEEGEVL